MPRVIDLSDRAFALAENGELREASASVVRPVGAPGGAAGESMLTRSRLYPTEVSTEHWSRLLGSDPAGDSARRTAQAELTARTLRARWQPAPGQRELVDVLATPGLEPRSLGMVLAMLRNDGIDVAVFRDAAVMTAAALGIAGEALVVELGLHHVAVTRVSHEAGVWFRNGLRVAPASGGLVELQQRWLALVAEAMVLRTRFDPLHDASTEQQLYDALPAALAASAQSGQVAVRIDASGREPLEVALTRDQLAVPVQEFMQQLASLLHSLRPAGTALTLVLPRVLAEAPGIEIVTGDFAGCDLLRVPDGFVATTVSAALMNGQLVSEPLARDGVVRLLRRCSQALAAQGEMPVRERLGAAAPRLAPTHLLFEGRAMAITETPLEVGRESQGLPRIVLPEGLAGVSRLHCSLRREAGQTILIDHSRYGTFVNGERVAGRAVVRAGDRLRIGDPGIELAMIAVGDTHATPSAN